VTTTGEQQGRPFFLNTGGFDGQQARLRRQIDQLQRCHAQVNARMEQHPEHAHHAVWDTKRTRYAQEIAVCWRKYERRNRELAHLAANILIFLAQIHGCALICGEQLASLRAMNRGKSVRGRWRNWRTNTTIRSEVQRVLAYKAHRWGIRCRLEAPKETSHTCPRCHQSANTYRSAHLAEEIIAVDWGKWLICANPLCEATRRECSLLVVMLLFDVLNCRLRYEALAAAQQVHREGNGDDDDGEQAQLDQRRAEQFDVLEVLCALCRDDEHPSNCRNRADDEVGSRRQTMPFERDSSVIDNLNLPYL